MKFPFILFISSTAVISLERCCLKDIYLDNFQVWFLILGIIQKDRHA